MTKSAKSVMMSAHALVPTELSHPERMQWMADYFMKHYVLHAVKAKLESEPPFGGDAYSPLYSMSQIERVMGDMQK